MNREANENKDHSRHPSICYFDQFLRHPWISVLTFDAIFRQHTVAKKLAGNGKKAIFQVKDNQRETLRRLRKLFDASATQCEPGLRSEEKKKQVDDPARSVAAQGAQAHR